MDDRKDTKHDTATCVASKENTMTNSREGTSVMTDSRELAEPVDSDAADMRRTSERPTEAPST
ncbi:MAG: hypothetical protein KDK70_39670, partial [Myxococcales bacterium]|nr:hypothetical protein [Myxococcales bacterium]